MRNSPNFPEKCCLMSSHGTNRALMLSRKKSGDDCDHRDIQEDDGTVLHGLWLDFRPIVKKKVDLVEFLITHIFDQFRKAQSRKMLVRYSLRGHLVNPTYQEHLVNHKHLVNLECLVNQEHHKHQEHRMN